MKKSLIAKVSAWIVLSLAVSAYPLISWAQQAPQHAPAHAVEHAGEPTAAPTQHEATPPVAADPHAPPAAEIRQGAPHAAPHGDEHAAPHGEHAEHGGHALKPINWADFSNKEQPPYLAMVINLLALIALAWIFGKKPIAQALVDRRNDIAKEIDEAQKMKEEAEARAKKYQAKLADLESEVATARAALVEAGKGERDRIVKEAEEKAARLVKDAQFLIEQEMKQVKQDLWRETVQLAVATAEEILKAKITGADQERLATEYLNDLADKPAKDKPAKDQVLS